MLRDVLFRLHSRSYKWLLLMQQNRHQIFNFWLLFFCQLAIEILSFPYYGYHSHRFPLFILTQIFLVVGWHFFFVLLSKLLLRFRTMINVLETILVVLVFTVEKYLFSMYKANISDSLFEIILSTNQRESNEFMQSIDHTQVLSVVLPLALFAFISYIFCLFSVKYESGVLLRIVYFVALLGVLGLTIIKGSQAYKGGTTPPSVTCGLDRIIWSPITNLQVNKILQQRASYRPKQEYLKGATLNSPFSKSVDFVIILGETARADYFSSYGFPKKTTPILDSLVDSGDAICFNDARSAANSTISSSKRIFTFWNDDSKKQWYDFLDILTCFKHAGYATRWYTNQETEGLNSVEYLFGRTAQEIQTPQGRKNGVIEPIGYDEKIIPVVRNYNDLSIKEKQENHAGQISVIHLMGSHYLYEARFPSKFKHFKTKDVVKKRGGAADNRVADYMNSIRYTDYVLGALYSRYKERPALVIYLSDHGESLYDNPEQPDLCGHAGRPCIEQADVPFVVLITPAFRAAYPELSKRIRDSRFRPISTAWLTNTLTLTAGIRTRYSDERYNFFGDKFAPPKSRTTEGEGSVLVFPDVKTKRVK